jgi:hypothetical protein
MSQPTLDEVIAWLITQEPAGATTGEVLQEFQSRGYDVDKKWFWDNIAPTLVERGSYTLERRQ